VRAFVATFERVPLALVIRERADWGVEADTAEECGQLAVLPQVTDTSTGNAATAGERYRAQERHREEAVGCDTEHVVLDPLEGLGSVAIRVFYRQARRHINVHRVGEPPLGDEV
jgi:hypothetical protein